MNLNLNSIEISPITGNRCVYTEPDERGYMKLCMESGYQYFYGYDSGSRQCLDYEEMTPKIIKDTKFVDNEGRIWYKTISMTSSTILYPDPSGWVVTTLRKLEDEEINNSLVTLIVNDVVMVIDDAHALHFDEFNFEPAMNSFYRLLNLTHDKN